MSMIDHEPRGDKETPVSMAVLLESVVTGDVVDEYQEYGKISLIKNTGDSTTFYFETGHAAVYLNRPGRKIEITRNELR